MLPAIQCSPCSASRLILPKSPQFWQSNLSLFCRRVKSLHWLQEKTSNSFIRPCLACLPFSESSESISPLPYYVCVFGVCTLFLFLPCLVSRVVLTLCFHSSCFCSLEQIICHPLAYVTSSYSTRLNSIPPGKSP